MTSDALLRVIQQSLLLVLLLSGPVVVACLVVGMVLAVFKAATQINEQTLDFAAKIIVTVAMLSVAGLWMIAQLSEFGRQLLMHIPSVQQ